MLVAAGIALFYVAAQAGGATDFEQVNDLAVFGGRVVVTAIAIAIQPEDVGNFPGWTGLSRQLFGADGLMHLSDSARVQSVGRLSSGLTTARSRSGDIWRYRVVDAIAVCPIICLMTKISQPDSR